jgi:hypothetical protein
MDFYSKTGTLQGPNSRRMVFRWERNIIPNYILSAMTVRKMMKKGYEAYLAYVMEIKEADIQLSNLFIMREFLDVFLDELPGVPPEKEVKVSIDVLHVCLL